MTVSNQTNSVSYSGNGSVTVFAYTFKIFADSDLVVTLRNNATGALTTQTLTTDYTVSGAGNTSGGNVTFGTAPPSGTTVLIRRSLPYTQETDYVENDPFPAASHEDALDKLTMLAQQNRDDDDAIKFPEGDVFGGINNITPSIANRANSYLTFDGSGNVSVQQISAAGANTSITQQDFTGDGSTTAFTLSTNPGAGGSGVSIYIDGIYQERDTYSISGTTLTFTEAPPLNASIEVINYRVADIGTADANNVTYSPNGSGAVQTTVQAKLRESVSVKDFGAVGDGVTDDTAAIQAALDYGLSNGEAVFFPGGRYRTTSELTINSSANSSDPTDGGKMVSLRGASPASSMIVADHNGVALSFIGGSGAGWHTYFYVDGIGITKSNKARNSGSVGLQLDDCAYAQFQRFEISYFEYGIKGTDILSSGFVDGTIRLNNYGFQFQKGTRSHPNNISFRGVMTLNNRIWGGQVIQPSLFDYIGGSIESNGFNGVPGDTNSWGVDIQNGGAEGSVAVNFFGVYIEGNNGRADVKILSDTTSATYNFNGCSFLRFQDIASRFTTNNIFFDSITESRLVVSGCGFKDFAPYVSSASREFIAANNAQVLDGGGNIFLDTSNGNTGINRAAFSPIGTNHQLPFASLPDVVKYRNGIQYCADGTGSSLPALAVSDGVRWNQIPLGQFSGRVASAGTALRLPRGWACSKTNAGVYVVTHNLGLAANTYSVVATPSGSPGTGYCSGMALSGNTFEIYFANTTGSATDMDFNFNMQII